MVATFAPLALLLASRALAGQHQGSWGSESGHNFQQQYTQQYAGDFGKFMSSGEQSKGGNVPVFAQDKLSEYAKSFEKYMNGPTFGQNATQLSAGPSGSYQQYVDDYAKQYMHGGGSQQQGAGGYSQYYESYVPQGQGAAGYQGYAEKYQHFSQGGGGDGVSFGQQLQDPQRQSGAQPVQLSAAADHASGQGSTAPANYEQYTRQYAGPYMQGGAQEHPGGSAYSHYYQGYMPQHSAAKPAAGGQGFNWQHFAKAYNQGTSAHEHQAGNPAGATALLAMPSSQGDTLEKSRQAQDWAAPFLEKFAGAAQGSGFMPQMKNSSDDWAAKYMQQYSEQYMPPPQQGNVSGEALNDYYKKKYAAGFLPPKEQQNSSGDWAAYYKGRYAKQFEKYMKQDQHELREKDNVHSGSSAPASTPAVEKATKPAAVPAAAQPAAHPAEKPAATEARPAAEQAAKPAAEPAVKPAAKPTAEPAEEPAAEPAAKPAAESAAEPATESQPAAAEPAAKLNAAKPDDQPAAHVAPSQQSGSDSTSSTRASAVQLASAERMEPSSLLSVGLFAALVAVASVAMVRGPRRPRSIGLLEDEREEGYVTMHEP